MIKSVLNERDNLGSNASPAGGLAISANDMARWLMIQLDGGALPDNGGRLFSQAAHDQMWTPVVLQPVGPRTGVMAPTQPMFNTYALGWDVRDYRGAKIVWHGGAVFGFLTAVVLIPEKNVGFSIEINSEDGAIIIGLMYELLDHYLGLPKDTWPEKILAQRQQRVQEALKAYQSAAANLRRSVPRCRSIATSAPIATPGTATSKSARPTALSRSISNRRRAWVGRSSIGNTIAS